MDQWRTDLGASTSVHPQQQQQHHHHHQHPSSRLHASHDEPRQREEADVRDPVAARKVQKADREKLRRDRLNEHFLELGSTLDPDRPKNDKATILTDTIQVLKDLTTEVNKLKAECAALTEESRELMQEKNELREEKSSLKSEVENLNVQYQQRMRVMYPWAAMDPSVMGPAYSYPVPIPVTPGPMPMHSQLQPFPFFGNQNASAIPAPCSTFIPYSMPANPTVEQQSTQYASSSHVSNKKDSKSRSSDHQRGSNAEQDEESNDVATDLELKMPGTSSQQDSGEKKGKQTQRKEISITDGSSSSKFSSSQAFPDSSSNSVSDNPKSSR